MKTTLKLFSTALICLGCIVQQEAYAQSTAISDLFNTGSTLYDFSNAETVTTDPTSGVGYVANGSGAYYRFGPAAATLTVNGYFNAFNPSSPPASSVPAGYATPATPGTDLFQGFDGLKNTAQEIAGTVAPRFGILKLDNGPNQINLTNTNGAEVGLRTDFANGITTTVRTNPTAGALKFLDNATYTNTALGDAQHVNGYVSKTGNDAFTFPVGSGTDVRTLTISAPPTVTDQFSVAWIAGNPTTTGDPTNSNALHPVANFAAPIMSVGNKGQWDWVPVSGTGAGLTITVSIPASTTAPAANLRLVGWNGTQWVNLGTAGATGNTENSTLSGTMILGISAIAVGSVDVLLPVKFVAIYAQADHCGAVITWQTATEQNSAHYVVEYSTSGTDFKAIGRVISKNSAIGASYTFSHSSPAAGHGYYRIKAVDTDGKFDYSDVAGTVIRCTEIVIAPNPVINTLTISGLTDKNVIVVYGANGQLIAKYTEISNVASIDFSHIAGGSYIVQVIKDKTIIASEKVIKL